MVRVYGWYLMQKVDATAEKLVDIIGLPDLGGPPSAVETTTLSDPMRTFMEGLKDGGALTFPVNYDPATYKKIEELKGQVLKLGVWHGFKEQGSERIPDGSEGKWNFDATVSIHKTQQNTNDPPRADLTVMPRSEIVFDWEGE